MTELLLDTHAALWWWTDLPRLSRGARVAIESGSVVHFSAISALEIAIKYRTGKLNSIGNPETNYRPLMDRNEFREIAVTAQDALDAGLLRGMHRDPFDRVIAAQALDRGLTVVTCDAEIAAFGCRTLW